MGRNLSNRKEMVVSDQRITAQRDDHLLIVSAPFPVQRIGLQVNKKCWQPVPYTQPAYLKFYRYLPVCTDGQKVYLNIHKPVFTPFQKALRLKPTTYVVLIDFLNFFLHQRVRVNVSMNIICADFQTVFGDQFSIQFFENCVPVSFLLRIYFTT